ncbi:hypothetical protein Acsp05_51910 [Actinokineospora sp. NBRC 105648]|nr:hypothetical protein Acsp05_51910 [Actinokineospora sp. NBRC 105648]
MEQCLHGDARLVEPLRPRGEQVPRGCDAVRDRSEFGRRLGDGHKATLGAASPWTVDPRRVVRAAKQVIRE